MKGADTAWRVVPERRHDPGAAVLRLPDAFAIITPALIVGANVERIGFGFVMLFSSLWMLLCHVPVTHWVWSGGWLGRWASCTKKRRDPDGGSRLT